MSLVRYIVFILGDKKFVCGKGGEGEVTVGEDGEGEVTVVVGGRWD